MRKVFRMVFLVVLGIVVGTIAYEGIMFVRVLWLRNHNPSSTSLIDTRIREAQARLIHFILQEIWALSIPYMRTT